MCRFISCCKGVKEEAGYCWGSLTACRVFRMTTFLHACGVGERRIVAVKTGGEDDSMNDDDGAGGRSSAASGLLLDCGDEYSILKRKGNI